MDSVQAQPATTDYAPVVAERESDERSPDVVRLADATARASRQGNGAENAVVYALSENDYLGAATGLGEALPSPRIVGVPKVLPDDYQTILDERERLILKKHGQQQLSSSEERRLEYLKWQVATIEDGQLAGDLARLEGLMDRVEGLAQRVTDGVVKFKEPYPAAFQPRRSSGRRP